MELAYVAHSERCALLLDRQGTCRWIVPKAGTVDESILGAQFVASLDPQVPGFLGREPRVGASLLFAIERKGRIALARFGPLQAFEKLDATNRVASTCDSEIETDSQLSVVTRAFDRSEHIEDLSHAAEPTARRRGGPVESEPDRPAHASGTVPIRKRIVVRRHSRPGR